MKRFGISIAALATLAAAALAQDAAGQAVPYCADLLRVVTLAQTGGRFDSIAGKAREGNFKDTILPLAGWQECSLYGAGMYTCDTQAFGSAAEADAGQAKTRREILGCLGIEWAEIKDRSSPGYVVLHPLRGPASITLSRDENDNKQHVVRLTLFIRR
jgi:hypothetical protein